jgi:hypothetical protein
MPYGTVKVDNVTFTNNSVDATTTFSGIYASITNNLTLSGTATAATFTGTTANFTNVNAQNISVTTSLSGLAITGGTAGFTTITGTTVTGTTANFVTVSGTTVTGNTGQFTNLAGAAAGFTTVTGTTVTGTTANFVSGVFTTRISGTTVTGTTASFTSGVFASLSGTTHTITSGVFALGTAALPSISFVSDPNTGIYSPGADQVAVATNGTGRLFIDANGSISINATGPKNPEGYNTTNFKFLTLQATTGATDRGAILELVGTGGGSPNFWLGRIGFFSTGNSYPHTSIESFTDSGGSNGGALFFNTTTTANASVPTERARIRSDGTFEIKGAGTGGSSPGFSVNPSTPANSFVIDSSGRLGIGTSSPGTTLGVAGNAQFGGSGGLAGVSSYVDTIGILGSSGSSISQTAGIQFGDNYTGASRQWGIYNGRSATGTNVGALSFVVSSAVSTDAMSGTGSTPLTLLSSGNVGIGSTAPTTPLSVRAVSNIPTYGNVSANFSDNTTGTLYISHSSGVQGLISDGTLAFGSGGSGTERARIDTSGRLLVGTSSTRSGWSNTTIGSNFLQIERAVTGGDAAISICSNSVDAAGSGTVFLGKTRGASLGLSTIVVSGDQVGQISFQGADGTQLVEAARIEAAIDGTPGASDMPGRIVFSTTADGASSPTEAMRINNAGELLVGKTTNLASDNGTIIGGQYFSNFDNTVSS